MMVYRNYNVIIAKPGLIVGILIFCSLGCTSNHHLRRSHHEVATLPHTLQKRMWKEVIKDSYPSWKEPSVTITSYNREKRRRVPKFFYIDTESYPRNSGHFRSKNAPQLPSKTFQKKERVTTYFTYEPKEELPMAILDRGDVIPPAATQGYKIVPSGGEYSLSAKQFTQDGLRRYEVSKGETLMQIARKYYGDESGWKRIFDANRDVITHPNHIKPGMTIIIP